MEPTNEQTLIFFLGAAVASLCWWGFPVLSNQMDKWIDRGIERKTQKRKQEEGRRRQMLFDIQEEARKAMERSQLKKAIQEVEDHANWD